MTLRTSTDTTKWISVKKQLPRPCTTVWAWCKTWKRADKYYVGAYNAECVDDISHWMPLEHGEPHDQP